MCIYEIICKIGFNPSKTFLKSFFVFRVPKDDCLQPPLHGVIFTLEGI